MRSLLKLVLIAVLVAPASLAVAQLPPGGTFVDDDGSVHEGDIEAIAAAGITRGCNPPGNDRFCPEEPVTRGEMAAFLVRALTLTEADTGRFTDDDGSIFEGDIERLAAAGITRGCNPPADNRFCPDRPVTRAEMAAFLVRAYDYPPASGDTFTDDDGSIFEGEIESLAAAEITRGCNPPANDRFCPGQAVTRQEMASFLARAEGLDGEPPPPRPEPVLVPVVEDLDVPLYVTSPPGDDRLFVVEQGGRIMVVDGGELLPEPFLDISHKVVASGEQGLLSMAFHPDYAANGRLFVYYTGAGPVSHIVELAVSDDPNRADPASESTVLEVDQPASNHNGGHLLFGPDGHLYVALGDGGGGNDPFENGQDTSTLLGKLLRLDVDFAQPYAVPADNPFAGGGGRGEIWALGLRNPWRIWFDEGLLYVADVGQSAREEINVVADNRPGVNYGWSRYEGSVCNPNDSDPSCASGGLEFPLVEYGHAEGCSVTGGVVYRGAAFPWLHGHYFYGDLCSGWIRSFRTTDGQVAGDHRDWSERLGIISGLYSFGTDADGEMYVVSGGSGTVYRMAPG